eukprot:scaffold2771_cov252-Pinguiococcus_pyrenoidosus.AAC.48
MSGGGSCHEASPPMPAQSTRTLVASVNEHAIPIRAFQRMLPFEHQRWAPGLKAVRTSFFFDAASLRASADAASSSAVPPRIQESWAKYLHWLTPP